MMPFLLLLGLGLVVDRAAAAVAGAGSPRAVVSLHDGWRFSRTEAEAPEGDCAASGLLPCQPDFDDALWRALSIPHDFVVEAPLVYVESDVAKVQGYRDYGMGWYRLRFSLPAEWQQQQRSLWIDFDGIMGNATTFLNGQNLGKHMSGYTSYRYPFDAALLRWAEGQQNVLAIHVVRLQL